MIDTDFANIEGSAEGTILPPAPAPKSAKESVQTVRIVLEENELIPASGLPLSHNGIAVLVKPGYPVDLPVKYLEILNAATMSVPVVDPQTQQVIDYRPRLKYPYRRVD